MSTDATDPVIGDLLASVVDEVVGQVDLDPASAAAFVRLLFRRLNAAELDRRGTAGLTAAATSLLELAAVRAPGEALVRVSGELDTVLEIVTDDMPFLVDSLRTELDGQGAEIELMLHPVVPLRREGGGRLAAILEPRAAADGTTEAVMRIELAARTAPAAQDLVRGTRRVLEQVRTVVDDWPLMRRRVWEAADDLARWGSPNKLEAAAFLRWLDSFHLTLLAVRDVVRDPDGEPGAVTQVEGSELGLAQLFERPATGDGVADLRLGTALVRSPVHRPDRLGFAGIRTFDLHGTWVGERQLLGLPTASAQAMSARDIPILRQLVAAVLSTAGFPANSHDAKALLEVLESFPREEMLRLTTAELYETALWVMGLLERPEVGVQVRRSASGRHVSCLVYVPADRYSNEVAERVDAVLDATFSDADIDTTVLLNDSRLARLHIVISLVPDTAPAGLDDDALQLALAAAARSWQDDLRDALVAGQGPEAGASLWHRYEPALPAEYTLQVPAEVAAAHLVALDALPVDDELRLELRVDDNDQTRLTLFRTGSPLRLSDVRPVVENFGSQVLDERPYTIAVAGEPTRWIYELGLAFRPREEDLPETSRRLAEAFLAVWGDGAENDRLNWLVLLARMPWRETALLRALTRYLRQAGTPFSQGYVIETLLEHPDLARMLLKLFHARLDPHGFATPAATVVEEITATLDEVTSLDEDRILRSLFSAVQAILRTNYYQRDADGQPKDYLSVKFDPALLPGLPLPRPMFEIWVYSPRMEGIHLRGGHVARGGLGWPDRRDDFRTEILGLLKAQTVKNAVIVPVGAKGGFVVKRPPADRVALAAEVVECYRRLIKGLLDLTDNLVPGADGRRTVVMPPAGVVRHDGDDPYLVVAADKGTAAFSDIANALAADYGYWLGDAFASGGSVGYDHKAMGITARGAWVSVLHHFAAMDRDPQTEPFTVAGIGDMSGDVFGNGMLLSEQIRLVAAFDHRHLFLDPSPDPATSFAERARLFALPGSSWDDYDRSLISAGGGVFSRTAKAVSLTPEVRALLDLDVDSLAPAELVQAILRARVDLLWNGGIGTYVKAGSETNTDVGDRANDALRVDASDLRALVIGEGGNLGLTQRARIEYALAGGRVNTDAIDNSAGVDTSDHEVNIKVLLDGLPADEALTPGQRLELLTVMTKDVARLVLLDNARQNAALAVGAAQAVAMSGVHRRYLNMLEASGRLDRDLEVLPTSKVFDERVRGGQGLTRPELAVLIGYTKIGLYDDVLASSVPDDPAVADQLERYFPPILVERLGSAVSQHPLRREIIASAVTNRLVNAGGSTFVFRLTEETGATTEQSVRAWLVAAEAFGLDDLRERIDAAATSVPEPVQIRMALAARRFAERVSRWILIRERPPVEIGPLTARLTEAAAVLTDRLPELVPPESADRLATDVAALVGDGVPVELAERVAGLDLLDAAPDIVSIADRAGRSIVDAALAYWALDSLLDLDWLYRRVTELPRLGRWQTLARAAARDDLYVAHAALAARALAGLPALGPDPAQALADVQRWADPAVQPELGRLREMLSQVRSAGQADLAIVSVALRGLRAAVG